MKSRYILVLSLIMAIVTTLLFGNFIKGLENKYKKEGNIIDVVVPINDIPKNTVVTTDMFKTIEVNEGSVHPDAIKDVNEIVGKYALVDMKADEILFNDRFTNEFQEKQLITRKIRDGYRAVSINVEYEESVSTMIEPEDYVDVVLSKGVNGTNGTEVEKTTEIILSNVRVLAVGKTLNEDGATVQNNQESLAYSSITLELLPEQVVTIINGDENGNIKFVLNRKEK